MGDSVKKSMRIFAEQNELIKFARDFVEERVSSLEKDVDHCLREPYAPFPALLYCFSTIDLLGALSAGDASKKARTTNQSENYMKRFMHYTGEQCRLLQGLFRHKLVHLAQPKAIIEDKDTGNSRLISWSYYHDDKAHHLKIIPKVATDQVTTVLNVSCTHEFNISISHLVKDIKGSVLNPNGYLASLETTPDLQDYFEKAISQIYDPSQEKK